MAKRESHALEVFLIVFVLLTAVSMMIALGVWVKLNRVADESTALASAKAKADSDLTRAEQENQTLRTMLGFDPRVPISDIDQAFTTDRGVYAAGLEEPQQNYRGIQAYLHGQVAQKSKQVLEAEDTLQSLQKRLEQARADEAAKAEELRKEATRATTELEKVRTELSSQQRQDDQQKQRLLQQLAAKTDELAKVKLETDAKVADIQRQLDLLKTQYQRVKVDLDKINEPTFEVPDGQITWVDQRSRAVWVNLGRQDGLRRNLTFTVYARDENNLNTAVKKGRIEITNVRNGHTAEGRIIEDENTNPILADDLIATPLWNPGTSLRYALTGHMDINQDGQDDRELVKNLIQQYGGRIDAEDAADGKITGEITVHTRYLVMGARPTDTSDPQQRQAYSEMVANAARFNVEQISVDKLIDAMGLGSRVRAAAAASPAAPANPPGPAETSRLTPAPADTAPTSQRRVPRREMW